jgi:hypothetical protein
VIVVAFPIEVTGPVRLASVVTVAALPVVFEVIVEGRSAETIERNAGAVFTPVFAKN